MKTPLTKTRYGAALAFLAGESPDSCHQDPACHQEPFPFWQVADRDADVDNADDHHLNQHDNDDAHDHHLNHHDNSDSHDDHLNHHDNDNSHDDHRNHHHDANHNGGFRMQMRG